MVDPGDNPGVQFFAITISVMVVLAGIASLPPARSFRPFVAAVVLCGLWLTNLFFETAFAISPRLMFFLDVICAVIFYRLATPEKPTSLPMGSFRRDWAAYLCLLFVVIIAFQIIGVLLNNEFQLKPLVVSSVVFCGMTVAWILKRANAWLALFGFLSSVGILISLAYFTYSHTIYYMMLVAYAIVIIRSIDGTCANITVWSTSLSSGNKGKNPQDERQALDY